MPSWSSAGYSRANSVGSTCSSLYTGMTTLSLGTAAGISDPLPSMIGRYGALRLQHVEDLFGPRAHQVYRAARLDVEAQQRLGVRGAQIEAPIGKFERHPVGAVARAGL